NAEIASLPEDLAFVGPIGNERLSPMGSRGGEDKEDCDPAESGGQECYFTTRRAESMKIAVAADHGGFSLKARIIRDLTESGNEVSDLGTNSPDPVDYPDYA